MPLVTGEHTPPAAFLTTAKCPARVLLIEDNRADVRLVREMLASTSGTGFQLSTADRLSAALELVERQHFDLLLLDLSLPDSHGMESFARLHAQAPGTPVVVLSGLDDEGIAVEAVREGAQDYLVKGQLQARALVRAMRYAVERQRAEDEIRRLNAELEQRVSDRTAELAAANAELAAANTELEAFSYSVSHDLRAPLRAADGFSQALLEDYGDRLDPQARHYLERVRAATHRMNQLIDALLKLSYVGRGELRREPLDLSALARTVLAELQKAQPERQVCVSVMDHLTVNADARLLRLVLDNLLGNAWKFTAKKPMAHIEFAALAVDGTWAYYVRDDGAGFDPAYSHKLFIPFQRLHSMSEFEGNGVGLATVQRIVQRHGGRIWAEGAVGEGATFWFTLE